MSDWGEPRRWHESDLPDHAREVLESAAVDDPSRERVASVESRLAGALGWPSAGEGAPSPSTSATSTGIATKAVVGAIVVAGAIGLGAWLATERAEVPRGAEAVPPSAEPERARAPIAAPELLPVPTTPSDPAPPRESPRPRTTRAITPEPAVAESAPPHPTISALEQELRLVDAARAALDRSPARALELADVHRQSFPTGTLSPERELLTIEALLALDRVEEATGRAATLHRDHPASPAAHRAHRLINERAEPQ